MREENTAASLTYSQYTGICRGEQGCTGVYKDLWSILGTLYVVLHKVLTSVFVFTIENPLHRVLENTTKKEFTSLEI